MRKPANLKVVFAAVGLAAVALLAFVALKQHRAPPANVSESKPVSAAQTLRAKAPTEPAASINVLDLASRGNPAQACSADGQWCVSLSEGAQDDGQPRPIVEPGADARRLIPSPEDASDGETHAVWPKLIALPHDRFVAGVEIRLSTSYSGGGGSATELRLYQAPASGASAAAPILTLPIQGSLMIRACFSEADVQNRAEACHDEYGFTGTVEVEPADAGLPVILYTTEAWAFPRGASREEDSTTRGPLTPADLVRTRDEKCSFRGRFRFDIASGAYEPDRPLPDCSAYTVP
jgi:hypothetical protein